MSRYLSLPGVSVDLDYYAGAIFTDGCFIVKQINNRNDLMIKVADPVRGQSMLDKLTDAANAYEAARTGRFTGILREADERKTKTPGGAEFKVKTYQEIVDERPSRQKPSKASLADKIEASLGKDKDVTALSEMLDLPGVTEQIAEFLDE